MESSLTSKIGLPPGTLLHVGRDTSSSEVRVNLINYSSETSSIKSYGTDDFLKVELENKKNWANINGLWNVDFIQKVGHKFNIDALLLEDIVNTSTRPKVDEIDNSFFFSAKMVGIHPDKDTLVKEQISIVLKENIVITFQEEEGDVFDFLRTRLLETKTKLKEKGADFLLYRLVDTLVDNYFYVTEFFSDKIQELENNILSNPNRGVVMEIQTLKNELIHVRKDIFPLREALNRVLKEKPDLIGEDTFKYFYDVYEHIIQVTESLDSQREQVSNLMDLYMSSVSQKMNQVMQLLTLISVIFIPLTFIAGIYGMNFENMPELKSEYGYFIVLGVMGFLATFMFAIYKLKGWLNNY